MQKIGSMKIEIRRYMTHRTNKVIEKNRKTMISHLKVNEKESLHLYSVFDFLYESILGLTFHIHFSLENKKCFFLLKNGNLSQSNPLNPHYSFRSNQRALSFAQKGEKRSFKNGAYFRFGMCCSYR